MTLSKSRFWQGIIIGAIAGGALSLIDKNTRTSVMYSCKKATGKVTYYVKHPRTAVEEMKEFTQNISKTIDVVTDEVSSIAHTINELKEITPYVVDIVMDTKDVMVKHTTNELDEQDKQKTIH
jgi:gas vesicle protein